MEGPKPVPCDGLAAAGELIGQYYIRDVVPMAGPYYLELFDGFDENKLRHVLVEDVFLFLHLIHRTLSYRLSPERRLTVMNAAVSSAFLEIAKRTTLTGCDEAADFQAWFRKRYNERDSEYGNQEVSVLFGEFAKRLEYEVGDNDSSRVVALEMIAESILKLAEGCADKFFP
jgi:hypothetical protein